MRLLPVIAAALMLAVTPAMAADDEDYANAGTADLTEEQLVLYKSAEEAYNNGNYAKARTDLKTLLDERVGAAWWLLGILDFQGLGAPKDEDKSRNHFIEAGKSGSAYYQVSLGDLYREGADPFKKDCDQAESWYKQAMMRGNEVAKDRLDLLRVCRGEPLNRRKK